MSQKQTFFLVHDTARARARQAVAAAPDGHMVVISEPKRRDAQNSRMHAMIGDIAAQTTYAGRKWDADDMKRLLVDEFAEEMRGAGQALHHDTRVVPSENGRRVIQLGIQTREFYVREASAFIEFLYAWGSVREVRWSEPVWEAAPA